MSLDKLISSYSGPSVPHRKGVTPLPTTPLIASANMELVELNERLPEVRRAAYESLNELIERETPNGDFATRRAVANFLSTIENPKTLRPTVHTDLLPETHPLSTKWISTFAIRERTGEYYAAEVDETISAVVASAITADPESGSRKFYVALLEAQNAPLSAFEIIAEADDVISKKELRP